MLIDLEQARPERLRVDVCIVGAGAAGLTLARALVQCGREVCVLEGGGLDFDTASQAFCAGTNAGAPYYDLIDARLRFFGGTTNIWGGRCVPLDPIDYERRDWVTHSGWPLSGDALTRYVRRAHDALGLGAFEYDHSLWQTLEQTPAKWIPEGFTTRFWRFDTLSERFQTANCTDLIDAPRCRIVIHANVQTLHKGPHAETVERATARTLDGHTTDVTANVFVVACGGIENARLLLSCDLGNHHDQVGRYFMEHPHGRLGYLRTDDVYRIWSTFRKRERKGAIPVAPVLVATPNMQRAHGILNSAITFKLQRDPAKGPTLNKRLYRRMKQDLDPSASGRRLWRSYRAARGWTQRHIGASVKRWRADAGRLRLSLIVRGEQSPNPNSRVRLSTQRDALGSPLATLDWQLSELDKRTVGVLAQRLDEALRAAGTGTIETAPWLDDGDCAWPIDPTVSEHPIGGYHHMGTTRMSASPRDGVVDADCRVHGIRNLYIAGSSVFPTGGWANPTLTLLALTYRLAEHIDLRSTP